MQQIKSMEELVTCLGTLEERVKVLESENKDLRAIQPSSVSPDANIIARALARVMPQTNLFSPSFLKRAFTVWGHFFVANLIIGVIVGIGYACLMMVLFGSLLGSMSQQGK